MNINEKVSFVKGLMEGLELEVDRKETKLIKAIVDLLGDMAEEVSNLEAGYDEISDQIESFDEELSLLEEDFFEFCNGDECCTDDCCQHDEDIVFEVTCPTCNTSICLPESKLLDKEIDCPNCGEKLEFDLDSIKLDDICDCNHDISGFDDETDKLAD